MSNEFELSVTQSGTIFVEAESEEEAIEKYQQNQGHYYVITEDGNEVPASDSWELDIDEDEQHLRELQEKGLNGYDKIESEVNK